MAVGQARPPLTTQPSTADEHASGWGGLNGNDLLSACEAHLSILRDQGKHLDGMAKAETCLSYISGFLDGFWVGETEKGVETFEHVCIPHEVNTGQAIRVVTKWLEDHPEKLHRPAHACVYVALRDAFPCRQNVK